MVHHPDQRVLVALAALLEPAVELVVGAPQEAIALLFQAFFIFVAVFGRFVVVNTVASMPALVVAVVILTIAVFALAFFFEQRHFVRQQVHGERRRDGPRQDIRRQHGENDGLGERQEQIARYSRQQSHGQENNTDGQRR